MGFIFVLVSLIVLIFCISIWSDQHPGWWELPDTATSATPVAVKNASRGCETASAETCRQRCAEDVTCSAYSMTGNTCCYYTDQALCCNRRQAGRGALYVRRPWYKMGNETCLEVDPDKNICMPNQPKINPYRP